MKILKRFVAKLSSFTTRHRDDQRLKEEITEHVALQIAENLRAGLSPAQARRQALLKFGAVESMAEDYRSERRFLFFDTLLQDIRFALRMLRKSPGFTAVAVLTLALGIGANTAIFSVIDAVLLRPLPYTNPGRLISVQEAGRGVGNSVSYPDFFDWQSQNHVFSGMASYHGDESTLTGAEEPTHIQTLIASADLFKVLQANPFLGRTFQPEDDQRGHDVAILSYPLWHGKFHASPDIIGKSIALNNERFTVIGVMPEGFQFPPTSHRDLWLSTAIDRESGSNIMTGRGYNMLSAIARLKEGTSLASAQTEMDLIARRLAQQYPKSNKKRTTVKMVPEIERIVGSVRASLFLILSAVIGVLLIACVNLANLSLARNTSRGKEIAVRAAVGASRSRIFRQLFTESILLSLLGGAAGIALAAWGTQELVRFAPQDLPRMAQVGLDWSVLAFAALLSIGTAIVFGSIPALRASKTNSAVSLKDASQTSSHGISHLRLRSGLVIVETGLAMVLLIGAGLLVSSYVRLVRVPLGFTSTGVLTFTFDLPSGYTTSQTVNLMNDLLPRLRALPGATAAAADWSLPFSGTGVSTGVTFQGRTVAPGNTPVSIVDAITPDYFQTMGIPLLKGRIFNDADNWTSLPVVIINEAFAQRYFPNENPIGKRIQPSFSMTNDYPWREIVAVVGNAKMGDLSEDFQPEFYMPFAQIPNYNAFVLKVQGDPLTLVSAVRAVVASLDKNLPLYNIQTMDGYLSSSIAARRFITLLLGLFAVLALVLATVGIYGVMAFSVSQRTRELGIRMALGADRGSVMQLVLWQGARLAFVGVAIGIGTALGLTRVLADFLFEVRATDPATYVAVAILLVVVALLACYIPARRATKVDPLAALRYE